MTGAGARAAHRTDVDLFPILKRNAGRIVALGESQKGPFATNEPAMSKRMIFCQPKRRASGLRAVVAAAMFVSVTGAAFAAGLHVGVNYSVPGETPRAIISAAVAPAGY